MILINSGGYVNSELQSEFGLIPACFIPVGNRRLLYLQVEQLLRSFPLERLVVSLPEGYVVPEFDYRFLIDTNVEVVTVPADFSLAESVLYALNSVKGEIPKDLRLLHGDTFIKEPPEKLDILATAVTNNNYGTWTVENKTDLSELVWAGFFAFSDTRRFLRCVARSKKSFVNAVKMYDSEVPLERKDAMSWLDFGHVNTFYNSRSAFTTERSFNDLIISNGVVTKRSSKSSKIAAESKWFEEIPLAVKRHAPSLLQSFEQSNGASYSLEYLPLTPLNELFVYGESPALFWTPIFASIKEILSDMRVEHITDKCESAKHAGLLFTKKTRNRLLQYPETFGYDVSKRILYAGKDCPSLMDLAEECILRIEKAPSVPAFMHGDLCFSNMLYDSRTSRIKLIDPRGLDENGNFTPYGCQTYDLAKLAHSIIGFYDYIIAGRYQILQTDNGFEIVFFESDQIKVVQEIFSQYQFVPGVSVEDIIPGVILLFISMVPLHADRPDRQKAMVFNAYRLYVSYMVRSFT